MDIALAVEEIYPAADFRRADSYEELERTWFDNRKIPTLAQLEEAWIIVEARLSAEADKQLELEQIRSDNKIPLDPEAGTGESALIQELVKKVVWLEREIRELRGF